MSVHFTVNRASFTGFTLPELLIVLLILGEIATFSIPKVLHAQENSRKKAVFKETIAALYEIQHLQTLQGNLHGGVSLRNAVLPMLNAVKTCETAANANGCWPQAWLGPYPEEKDEAGAVLANGATIAGLKESATNNGKDAVIIDWNGPAGENIPGQDQLIVWICYDSSKSGFQASSGCQRQGTMVPVWSGDYKTANKALWESLWE